MQKWADMICRCRNATDDMWAVCAPKAQMGFPLILLQREQLLHDMACRQNQMACLIPPMCRDEYAGRARFGDAPVERLDTFTQTLTRRGKRELDLAGTTDGHKDANQGGKESH